jgi:hypothetical protein
MIDRIGQAIAVSDGADFQAEPVRYRRLAVAAFLERPKMNPI